MYDICPVDFICGNAQQFSYERSSQAQRLTCPPHLIFADCGGLFVDIRRMAFDVI
jgi:hypothetical protein